MPRSLSLCVDRNSSFEFFSTQDVLNTPPRDHHTPDVRSATFYSVTSTQRGLDGIGLGNLLIKRVVERLRTEFYNITDFVTLSPVPGFRKWLDAELLSIEQTALDSFIFISPIEVIHYFKYFNLMILTEETTLHSSIYS